MADPTTNEQLAAKVVEAVTAVQNAEETVVNEGKRLITHMADPNAHGQDVGACIAQAVADHEGNDAAHGLSDPASPMRQAISTAAAATVSEQIAAPDSGLHNLIVDSSASTVENILAAQLGDSASSLHSAIAKASTEVSEGLLAGKADAEAMNTALAAKADTDSMVVALASKADLSILVSATIGTEWSGSAPPYTQTVSVAGVTPASVVEVLLATTATKAQVEAYQGLNWTDGGQANGSISLRAWGKINTTSIPVTVIIRS